MRITEEYLKLFEEFNIPNGIGKLNEAGETPTGTKKLGDLTANDVSIIAGGTSVQDSINKYNEINKTKIQFNNPADIFYEYLYNNLRIIYGKYKDVSSTSVSCDIQGINGIEINTSIKNSKSAIELLASLIDGVVDNISKYLSQKNDIDLIKDISFTNNSDIFADIFNKGKFISKNIFIKFLITICNSSKYDIYSNPSGVIFSFLNFITGNKLEGISFDSKYISFNNIQISLKKIDDDFVWNENLKFSPDGSSYVIKDINPIKRFNMLMIHLISISTLLKNKYKTATGENITTSNVSFSKTSTATKVDFKRDSNKTISKVTLTPKSPTTLTKDDLGKTDLKYNTKVASQEVLNLQYSLIKSVAYMSMTDIKDKTKVLAWAKKTNQADLADGIEKVMKALNESVLFEIDNKETQANALVGTGIKASTETPATPTADAKTGGNPPATSSTSTNTPTDKKVQGEEPKVSLPISKLSDGLYGPRTALLVARFRQLFNELSQNVKSKEPINDSSINLEKLKQFSDIPEQLKTDDSNTFNSKDKDALLYILKELKDNPNKQDLFVGTIRNVILTKESISGVGIGVKNDNVSVSSEHAYLDTYGKILKADLITKAEINKEPIKIR